MTDKKAMEEALMSISTNSWQFFISTSFSLKPLSQITVELATSKDFDAWLNTDAEKLEVGIAIFTKVKAQSDGLCTPTNMPVKVGVMLQSRMGQSM